MAADDPAAKSPSGKKTFAKPRKIGFLYVMEKARFSTKWVKKFCMLTDANQLDWYLKQEDHVERSIQGSVKKVDQALIEELDATAGRNWAFSLKVKGKTQIFAGEDEQDRLNWVVECIKMRPIREIIDMCDNSKLQRQSAMALCNQSSNPQGTIQLEIVENGGATRLLEFISDDKEPDEKLYDAIYFAFGRLAARAENRSMLATHLDRFINLACKPSGNPVWRSSAGKFIQEMACDASIRRVIHANGGVARLVDMLVMDKKAPQHLQREAALAIEKLSEDEEIRRDLGLDLLLPLVDAITPVAKQAQQSLVKTLISISRDADVFAKMRALPELLPVVLNLLTFSRDLPEEDVQTVASQFVLSLTHSSPDIVGPSGMSCLVVCSASALPEAALNSLSAMHNFLARPENVFALASLGNELIGLIRLIAHADYAVQKLATQIVSTVCQDGRSLDYLMTLSPVIDPLLSALNASLASPDEEVLQQSLIILMRISSYPRVKVALCDSPVFAQVTQLISTLIVGRSLLFAVQVCENAADSPFVRQLFLRANCLKIFVEALKSQKDPATLVSLANLLAYCAADERLVAPLVGSVAGYVASALAKPADAAVKNALARILHNAAFFPGQRAAIAVQAGACLCQQLADADSRQEIASTLALVAKEEPLREPLQALGFKPVLEMLAAAAAPTTHASLLAVLAAQARIFGAAAQKEFIQAGGVPVVLGFLARSFADTDDDEHCLADLAMLVVLQLLEAGQAGDELSSCIFAANGFSIFFDCLLSPGAPAPLLEAAARSLNMCLASERLRADFLKQQLALDKFPQTFCTLNLVVLRHACQMLGRFCQDKGAQFVGNQFFARLVSALVPLLHFPDEAVRGHYAQALLALSTNAKGEIEFRTLKEASEFFGTCTIADGAQLGSSWLISPPKPDVESPSIDVQCSSNNIASVSFESYAEFRASMALVLAASRYPDYKPSEHYQRELKAIVGQLEATKPTNWSSLATGDEVPAQHQTNYRSVLQQIQSRPSSRKISHRKRTSASSNASPAASLSGKSSRAKDRGKSSRKGKRESMASSFFAEASRPSGASSTIDESVTYENLHAILHYRSAADSVFAESRRSAAHFLKIAFGMPALSLPKGDDAWASSQHAHRCSPAPVLLGAGSGSSDMLRLSDDHTLSYTFSDHRQAASVQGSSPFCLSSVHHYFEVLVLSAGTRGTIGVGLAPRGYPSDLQPGWLPGSFGFHGDDGNKYGTSEPVKDELLAADSELVAALCKYDAFGPTFTTNDVIGCGYNPLSRELFYTKNGLLIGTAFTDVPPGLYPTIGLASPDESVYVNFGQGPFLFDFNFDKKLPFVPAPKADPGQSSIQARLYRPSHICDAMTTLSRDWSFSDRRIACGLSYFSSLIRKSIQSD